MIFAHFSTLPYGNIDHSFIPSLFQTKLIQQIIDGFLSDFKMNEIIVQWQDGSSNLVKFTDLKPCDSFFRAEWIHNCGNNINWVGTIRKIYDDENIEIEWDKGGINTVSYSDVSLIDMHAFKGKVTWKYDSKWVGDIKITKKLKRFNPKVHKFSERVELDTESSSSEDDTAQPNEGQSDPESDSETSESESSDREQPNEDSTPRWRSRIEGYPEIKFLGERVPSILVRDPIDYFKDYFSDEFVALVVQQSNLYIRQKNPNSQLVLQEADIYVFLGATFYMSLFGMTNSRRYWSEKCRIALIADVISQKQFEFIKSSIHFVDN